MDVRINLSVEPMQANAPKAIAHALGMPGKMHLAKNARILPVSESTIPGLRWPVSWNLLDRS
jgi:hypothetical protein